MKTIILFLTIFIWTSLVQSQTITYQNDNGYCVGITNGAQFLNRAYTVHAQTDTTQAIGLFNIARHYISIQSKDSASIIIKYQLSVDGVTWGVLNTQDSLSTASNIGDVETLNMTTEVLGARYVRYIFYVQGFRLGKIGRAHV